MARAAADRRTALYRTETASAVPAAADLVRGELAVNLPDRRLFTKDQNDNVIGLGDSLVATGTEAEFDSYIGPAIRFYLSESPFSVYDLIDGVWRIDQGSSTSGSTSLVRDLIFEVIPSGPVTALLATGNVMTKTWQELINEGYTRLVANAESDMEYEFAWSLAYLATQTRRRASYSSGSRLTLSRDADLTTNTFTIDSQVFTTFQMYAQNY